VFLGGMVYKLPQMHIIYMHLIQISNHLFEICIDCINI
jgi:hypothetical protein